MNRKGGTPPESGKFSSEKQPESPGRTPTKWLRDLLSAAHDKSKNGPSHREAIGMHLIEVATSWTVKIKGRGEEAYEVADAKDSVAAAELLMRYDMGEAPKSLEVSGPNGGPIPTEGGDGLNTEQRASVIVGLLTKAASLGAQQAKAQAAPSPGPDGNPTLR